MSVNEKEEEELMSDEKKKKWKNEGEASPIYLIRAEE